MESARRAQLLHHLREELAGRRKYLEYWEKQDPIELYSPPVFLRDIRVGLIDAAKAEIQVMEQAIDLLQRPDTEGP